MRHTPNESGTAESDIGLMLTVELLDPNQLRHRRQMKVQRQVRGLIRISAYSDLGDIFGRMESG